MHYFNCAPIIKESCPLVKLCGPIIQTFGLGNQNLYLSMYGLPVRTYAHLPACLSRTYTCTRVPACLYGCLPVSVCILAPQAGRAPTPALTGGHVVRTRITGIKKPRHLSVPGQFTRTYAGQSYAAFFLAADFLAAFGATSTVSGVTFARARISLRMAVSALPL